MNTPRTPHTPQSAAFSPARRRWLKAGLALGTLGMAGVGTALWARPHIWNPCLPPALAQSPQLAALLAAAWDGLDPAQLWDGHVHLAGTGDSGGGISISADMLSLAHPVQYTQRLFYLNAGCTRDGAVDASFVESMLASLDAFPPGAKALLLAFDHAHDMDGTPRPEASAFYVPNEYAAAVVAQRPDRLAWACSVHPARADAVEALDAAVAAGACAVKWLPPAMGIDPGDARCDRFYTALARHDLPLICHAGAEKAVHGIGAADWSNPLRLRRALDHGVRVVFAHCASHGEDIDLDRAPQGDNGPLVPAFELFARLMDTPAYAGRAFGDVSALLLRNRDAATLRTVLARTDWHDRLLYGSDHPLPGVLPLVSPRRLARDDLLGAVPGLAQDEVISTLLMLRRHNALLFNFVLTRLLEADGQRLAPAVFASRSFFDRKPS